MKRHLILLAVLALIVVGCDTPAIRQVPAAGHPDAGVKVEVMTEFDGIRLYRVNGVGAQIFVAARIADLTASWQLCSADGDGVETCDDYKVQTLAKVTR